MRDFTSNSYCDYLWIYDLLSLKKDASDKEFNVKLIRDNDDGEVINVSILNVAVYGTIVGIKDLDSAHNIAQFVARAVDDGTGIIACKYNNRTESEEMVDLILAERKEMQSETPGTEDMSESRIDLSTASADDTIFNDRSLQEDEAAALEKSRLQTLCSIYEGIHQNMSCMTDDLCLGDTILVQGKLYNYFNTNQVFVNTMRFVDLDEEMLLTSVKLEQGYKVLPDHLDTDETQEIEVIENKRRSGILTFDNIHHTEIADLPTSKLVTAKEHCDCALEETRKRLEPVSSPFELDCKSMMTFDTMTDLSET